MDNESVLDSVKKLSLIDPDDTSFDPQICVYINSVFSTLYQIGVLTSFAPIMDNKPVWGSYISDPILLSFVISYVGAKVKLKFDPPAGSSAMDALVQIIAEDEWRINSYVDYKPTSDGEEDNDDI